MHINLSLRLTLAFFYMLTLSCFSLWVWG